MRIPVLAVGLVLAMGFACSQAEQSVADSFKVIGTISGPDGRWDYASVDAVARRLYVAHGDAVLAVDLETGKLNPKLLTGRRFHTVVPLAGGKGLVTDSGRNAATIFEADTGKILATIPTGAKPDAAVFDPATGLVFVMNAKDGNITLIDPRTATAPGRIDVGGELEFAAVDGRGRLYVNIDDQAKVAVIDTIARKVVARYRLPDCEEASGLALDPATDLLVASCSNEQAVALNARDGTVAARIPIGKGPDAVIFDAERKLFFIPCESGTLTVIAERTGAAPVVVATVATAVGARTGALDPKTGRLYLPAADLQAGPPDEHAPSMPGTFRILIVGVR